MGDAAIIVFSLLGFVALILLLVMVPLHFSYVEYGHYALKRNSVTNEVDSSTVYTPGRYAWGISYAPIPFASTKIRVDFTGARALSVFTEGGQELTLEFVAWYRLIRDDIPKLYKAFGQAHGERVLSIARAELRNAATKFVISNYTENRARLGKIFYTQLSTALSTKAYVSIDENSFFIGQVSLPNTTLAQKVSIFQTTQGLITQQFLLLANATRLETTKNVTSILNQAELVRQNATAEASRMVSDANANHFLKTQTAIGLGLANMSQALGVIGSDNVSALLIKFNQMLDRTTSATIMTGVKGALVQNG